LLPIMKGFRFGKFNPQPAAGKSDFERLLSVFTQLLFITAGDATEALHWLTEVDRQHKLTTENYGIGDFIEQLKREGYLTENPVTGAFSLRPKAEQHLRQSALEEIFGKLKKAARGNHSTVYTGRGDEPSADRRAYTFGDSLEQIAITDSIRNAQINHGTEEFHLTEDDLEIIEQEYKTQTSTVLLIDISHSMILYGEDRITPARQVALALAELIRRKYPKDTLDFVAFGDDARPIELKDLPYLQVGPYHTNTVAALEMAMDILRRRKNPNKQIFMITDGKPTCIKQGISYYKNPFGLDKKIINRTLTLAAQLRKLNIPVTTFMIASDPYLKAFVRQFTRINNGNAYYSSVEGLGHLIFEDFRKNRVKHF